MRVSSSSALSHLVKELGNRNVISVRSKLQVLAKFSANIRNKNHVPCCTIQNFLSKTNFLVFHCNELHRSISRRIASWTQSAQKHFHWIIWYIFSLPPWLVFIVSLLSKLLWHLNAHGMAVWSFLAVCTVFFSRILRAWLLICKMWILSDCFGWCGKSQQRCVFLEPRWGFYSALLQRFLSSISNGNAVNWAGSRPHSRGENCPTSLRRKRLNCYRSYRATYLHCRTLTCTKFGFWKREKLWQVKKRGMSERRSCQREDVPVRCSQYTTEMVALRWKLNYKSCIVVATIIMSKK